MTAKDPYTVYAVFDSDNTQRYTAYVDAANPSHAEELAKKSANADILIAGVVKGYIAPVDSVVRKDITPLHGRSHVTWVSRLVATSEPFQIPRYCPCCHFDLRKVNSLRQTNFPARVWDARLPRDLSDGEGWGALLNEDRGATIHGNPAYHILAVRLVCVTCRSVIWDGYHCEDPKHAPAKRTRRR